MELFYENKGNPLKVKFKGINSTLIQPIVEELNENKDIEYAGFHIEHPLKDEILLIIKAEKSKDPKEILIKTIEKLKKELTLFSKEVDQLKF